MEYSGGHSVANQRWIASKLSAVAMLKLERGCVDCGYDTDPVALDFDHVRGEKLFTVSGAAGRIRYGMDAILDEIEKCEVVCSNCHRIRTHDRRKLATHSG